jgi:hypothetical protein
MAEPQTTPGTRALADLDAVIGELESARVDARRELARSHGTQAEALAVALKGLDGKLLEARAARDKLTERMRRTARLHEITAELKALKAELEGLAAGGDQGERSGEIRRRALALQAELTDARIAPRTT